LEAETGEEEEETLGQKRIRLVMRSLLKFISMLPLDSRRKNKRYSNMISSDEDEEETRPKKKKGKRETLPPPPKVGLSSHL
jgi:hypothetical protein